MIVTDTTPRQLLSQEDTFTHKDKLICSDGSYKLLSLII